MRETRVISLNQSTCQIYYNNSWNCSSWILFLVLKIVLLNILIAAVIHGTNSALYLTDMLIPVLLQVKEMDLDQIRL